MTDDAKAVPAGFRGLPRRMYYWVLSWAGHPLGPLALFVLSFVESSFFPIPPDPLLMALCLGAVSRSFQFAALCTAASVLGGLLGYGIGYAAFESVAAPILDLYGKLDGYEKLAEQFREQGDLAVLVAAITPVPYKLVTITAGAMKMNLVPFVVASVVGRGLRFFAVAGLLWWKGETVRALIETWFEWLALAFGVLLVGGIVAVRYLH